MKYTIAIGMTIEQLLNEVWKKGIELTSEQLFSDVKKCFGMTIEHLLSEVNTDYLNDN